MARGTRCTVQRATGSFCDAPTAEDMPFPICPKHAIRLFIHMRQTVNENLYDPELLAYIATLPA